MTTAFSEKLTAMLNAAACSTALGVASRTGLLAALAEEPLSAAALAAKAKLSARYVEETLAVLVCGDVVVLAEDGDDGELRYSLPRERQDALAGLGIYFEELPLLSSCAFPHVCEAAATGKGVASSNYQPFGAWMGKLADHKHAQQLTQKFLPALRDGAVVAMLQREGARVLDLGCGRGTAARLIAAAFPSATVTGVDIDEASIAAAKAHPDVAHLHNLEFLVGDASDLAAHSGGAIPAGGFDLVLSFDAIHDLPDPLGAMRTARALVKAGSGLFAMVDIRAETALRGNLKHSMGPFLYAVSLMHCMPQGLNSPDASGKPGLGLGMMWGRGRATCMLQDAGFGSVEVLELVFDTFNDVYLASE